MKTVLVFFDTLRRDAISPYNGGVNTPAFDRLASMGCTFDNHYAGSMPCMPARRELHTGRYNFLHRSWGPLEPFDRSMPRALRDGGVHSHLISDHYHYWEGGGATYHTRYSTWECVRGQEGDPWIADPGFADFPDAIGCTHRTMTEQDEVNRRWMLANGYHPQRETFAKGLSFLSRNAREDNWFLQLETFDPHEPFWTDEGVTDAALHDYDGPRFDWPAYGDVSESSEQIAHVRRRYRELVAMCDRQLDRVLDAFDRFNLWKDTALIVTTDHGFLLGEHRQWGKVVQPLFSEVIRLPLLVYVPPASVRHGDLPATVPGSRCGELTQTVDLAPTVLALHGLDRSADHYDGLPLQGALERMHDPAAGTSRWGQARRYALYGVFGAHVCVTDGRYTYFRSPQNAANGPLYEHTLMPWKMRDPAAAEDLTEAELVHPDRFARGLPVLRYPGHPYSPKIVPWLRDFLFDIEEDPGQEHNLLDKNVQEEHALRERWNRVLADRMVAAASPPSQFERLGLDRR
ncbi:MAG: sulfatase [Spirochaetales bacterium]|nr:sulfatase [Spirochaetales bacterium]